MHDERTPDDARTGAAIAWQTRLWNRMADTYRREIDVRFAPVVDAVVELAALRRGETVLDLGTGTGTVARRAGAAVRGGGRVVGVDLSAEMLAIAAGLAAEAGAEAGGAGRSNAIANAAASIEYREGRAEAIPCADGEFDVVLASLSLMFAVDRAAAAREIARVLKPGGRFVAAVWGAPHECDLIRMQTIAAAFAPEPPVQGVGPGALGDPAPFAAQLADVGVPVRIESRTVLFDFPSFEHAWDVFASVTAAKIPPDRLDEAKAAVVASVYPAPERPRTFRNVAHFLVGARSTV